MKPLNLVTRILLCSTFLYSGITQIFSYTVMQNYIINHGAFQWLNHMMSPLLPLAIFIDLLASISIIVNYQLKFWAYCIGTYTLLLNLYFNMHFAELNSTVIFFLELSLSGAFYYIALNDKGTIKK